MSLTEYDAPRMGFTTFPSEIDVPLKASQGLKNSGTSPPRRVNSHDAASYFHHELKHIARHRRSCSFGHGLLGVLSGRLCLLLRLTGRLLD